MRAIIALLAFLQLTACATTSVQLAVFNVDRQRLSDCTYIEIKKEFETGINKTDNPTQNMSRIAFEGSSTLYWELVFATQTQSMTRVEFKPNRNMWGSDAGGARNIWPAVQSCAASLNKR
jgi:hypothetical protein